MSLQVEFIFLIKGIYRNNDEGLPGGIEHLTINPLDRQVHNVLSQCCLLILCINRVIQFVSKDKYFNIQLVIPGRTGA